MALNVVKLEKLYANVEIPANQRRKYGAQQTVQAVLLAVGNPDNGEITFPRNQVKLSGTEAVEFAKRLGRWETHKTFRLEDEKPAVEPIDPAHDDENTEDDE
jgi:hypothetical protein